jgi:hypothetical protein
MENIYTNIESLYLERPSKQERIEYSLNLCSNIFPEKTFKLFSDKGSSAIILSDGEGAVYKVYVDGYDNNWGVIAPKYDENDQVNDPLFQQERTQQYVQKEIENMQKLSLADPRMDFGIPRAPKFIKHISSVTTGSRDIVVMKELCHEGFLNYGPEYLKKQIKDIATQCIFYSLEPLDTELIMHNGNLMFVDCGGFCRGNWNAFKDIHELKEWLNKLANE